MTSEQTHQMYVLAKRVDLQFCIDAICHLKEHKARILLERILASGVEAEGFKDGAADILAALQEANAFILAPAEDIKESVLSRLRDAIAKASASTDLGRPI